MAKTQKVLNDEIKVRFLDGVAEHLTNVGEEVLRTGSNEIALPVLDEDGNEKWLVLTFKVPTGSRDGDAYDGYSMAEDTILERVAISFSNGNFPNQRQNPCLLHR